MPLISRFYPLVFPLAISLEVIAYPKPGNVHRYSDLQELRLVDFLVTSSVTTPCFYRGFKRGIYGWHSVVFGDLVYCGVKNMVKFAGTNTSLGSITLLAPLSVKLGKCFSDKQVDLECVTDIRDLLKFTSVKDTIYFYRAVRLAKPSLPRLQGKEMDLVDVYARDYARQIKEKGLRLVDVLQYSRRIEVVHDELMENYRRSREALSILKSMLERSRDWNESVIVAHLYLLSTYLDTLVIRRWGLKKAIYILDRARELYREALMGGEKWLSMLDEFDRELRASKINPGSTADLLCSTIALYLIERISESGRLIP